MPTHGRIEVICGSMFSGKTAELLRRMERARLARRSTLLFKPSIDTRYHKSAVISHSRNRAEAIPVEKAADILHHINGRVDVVGIDEAQFFDEELPHICQTLAERGSVVILAGLDLDYRAEPFGGMPTLLAMAEHVLKLRAICMRCGEEACRTQRVGNGDDQIQLGEKDTYEARCRNCFEPPKKSA